MNVDVSSDAGSLHEGDQIDVVCKLFEIGTGVEVPISLLPADTTFRVSVLENGSSVLENTGSDLTLTGVELHNCLTEITAEVEIKGSSAIRLTTGTFTPARPVVYSIGIEAPDNFTLTIDELKKNTQSIRFVIYENGMPLPADQVAKLPFSIETEMPGKIVHEADGAISFTPLYRDPVTTIPMGAVEVKGILAGVASVTASLYIKPIEYRVSAIGVDADSILRTALGDNMDGARFELSADGVLLGKTAVEAAELDIRLNGIYSKRLTCLQEIGADGRIRLIPQYGKWDWLIPYLIPTGTLTITLEFAGGSDSADIVIARDLIRELIFNYLIPAAILAFIVGHLVKKRFVYSSRIAFNLGVRKGMFVSGAVNGWNSQTLWCLSALCPFLTDVKRINGIYFHAAGGLGNRRTIRLKCAKLSKASGMVNEPLDEMRAVRFRALGVMPFGNAQWKTLAPRAAFVDSPDATYSVCQVYLYLEK
jgi:hypothetical protein